MPALVPEAPHVPAPVADKLTRGGLFVAALAAAAQLGLLLYGFARRLLFPFDLEWLEGGMLCHALRLMDWSSTSCPSRRIPRSLVRSELSARARARRRRRAARAVGRPRPAEVLVRPRGAAGSRYSRSEA